MIVLGLTGSIGTGKSTAAAMLKRLGLPVHDADAAVHKDMGPGGGAVPLIEAAFPGTTSAKGVDRQALGARVFGDDAALTRLEAILHPSVRQAERHFLCNHARLGTKQVVLDIPLLFETDGDARCDATITVYCSASMQRRRVLSRPGMTAEKLDQILTRQMSQQEKRRRADFQVSTGVGRAWTLRHVQGIVTLTSYLNPRAWRAGR